MPGMQHRLQLTPDQEGDQQRLAGISNPHHLQNGVGVGQ